MNAVIDIAAGGLVVATPTTSTVLSPAVILRSHPAAAQLSERDEHGRILCGPGVDRLAAANRPGVRHEPWEYIDSRRVEVSGTAVSFTEVAGATLRRASRWLNNQHQLPASGEIRLIVPTHWGTRRRATAVGVAAAAELRAQPLRAALVIADALESSYARWVFVVEWQARGACVSLIQRLDQRLRLEDKRFVLAVDPDDDVPGGGAAERIMRAIAVLRDRHRGTRTGSMEVLVTGRGAEAVIRRCDQARILSFPVSPVAAAERAVTLTLGGKEIGGQSREPTNRRDASLLLKGTR